MYSIGTVAAQSAADLAPYLDQMMQAEYRAGRIGTASQPQLGQETVYSELWLLAINRPGQENSSEWIVYALTSDQDIPGWPYDTDYYTGGVRTPEDIAQALASTGYTVAMRHYSGFSVSSAAVDVTLT